MLLAPQLSTWQDAYVLLPYVLPQEWCLPRPLIPLKFCADG